MAAQPVGAPPLRVDLTARGQEVTIDGRIDVHTVPDIRLALHAFIAEGSGDLYLHLGAAEIADATGIGLLVECHNRARRSGRRLVLGQLTPRTERLLRAVRLHRVLHRELVDATVSPFTT